jgi:OOP family OmpA-OmpF porin
MKLSDARARSVMDYLIAKGVNRVMLIAKGYGENEPIADNKTAEGRAKNRRVGLRRAE